MIKNTISAIASFASIISLAFINGITIFPRICIIIFGISGLSFLFYDALRSSNNKIYVCKSENEINDYMYKWVRSQGKVCIMSRDLSWVDQRIERLLINKKDSMMIYAQAENELTKRLCSSGVKVLFYGRFGFEPQSRFTIIRYNKPDKQIAIANTIQDVKNKGELRHTIYQTSVQGDMRDGWILSLATDLTDLLKKTCS